MIKAIIFDVDGVLLDSFESNLKYFNELFPKFGYKKLTHMDYSRMFPLPTYDVIKAWATSDEKKIKEIMAEGDRMPLDNSVEMPPGAYDVVVQLKKKYKLGIVSGRQRDNLYEGEMSKCKGLFDVGVGYEDTKLHKPSPEPLLLAMKKLNVSSDECAYIGDALIDVQAGNAAGIPVIFYGKEKPEGAIANASSFKEILEVIKTLKY